MSIGFLGLDRAPWPDLTAGVTAVLVLTTLLARPPSSLRSVRLVARWLAGALLVWAAAADGTREAAVRCLVLHHHVVAERAQAPAAALPLVLAAAALVAGSAFGWRRPCSILPCALRLATALVVLRWAVERSAAPEWLARGFGLFWLAPAVGLALAVRGEHIGARGLLGFAWGSRVPVAALAALAAILPVGGHLDLRAVPRVDAPWRDAPLYLDDPPLLRPLLTIALPQLVLGPAWSVLSLVGCRAASLWLVRAISSRRALTSTPPLANDAPAVHLSSRRAEPWRPPPRRSRNPASTTPSAARPR